MADRRPATASATGGDVGAGRGTAARAAWHPSLPPPGVGPAPDTAIRGAQLASR